MAKSNPEMATEQTMNLNLEIVFFFVGVLIKIFVNINLNIISVSFIGIFIKNIYFSFEFALYIWVSSLID